ncbi:hypothetical protein [Hoylesella buccalis]|nr:hypothetical protein [Hoylesella buccalis]
MDCNTTAIRYPDHPKNNVKYHYGRGKLDFQHIACRFQVFFGTLP